MKKTTVSNIQLGFFVMVGMAFLVAALYYIGSNRSLFDKTFTVHATFYNVNGLMKGNNVRFSGIDVGTIDRVEITSDTSILVTMLIEDRVHPFIKKNSLASVGTDGLMGNKLVNITNLTTASKEIVQEGDMLMAVKPVETDEMLRTLDKTNENLYHISGDIKKITQKVNNSNSLWNILMDTTVAENVKLSVYSLRLTTQNTAAFTAELNRLLNDIKEGKGVAGTLLYDSASSASLKASLQQLNAASQHAAEVTKNIAALSEKMKRGEGAAGVLLSDTAFASDLKKSMHKVAESTERLDENMEAMRSNFLFRGYFKQQEKDSKKLKADSVQAAKKK